MVSGSWAKQIVFDYSTTGFHRIPIFICCYNNLDSLSRFYVVCDSMRIPNIAFRTVFLFSSIVATSCVLAVLTA